MKDEINVKENFVWACTDFYSAVLLRASGIPLIRLDKSSDKSVTFYFEASHKVCDDIFKKHWDRSLRIESRLIIETINELKTRVHEKMRGES